MDNIIKQIIEIDRIACEKTKKAEQKRVQELDKLESLKSSIVKNWDKNNQSVIDGIKSERFKILNQDIGKINEDRDKKINQINNIYLKYKEEWSQAIFDNIINKVD